MVLSRLQQDLQSLEYEVETSKKKAGRIEIPIHDGTGRLVRHIDPDAPANIPPACLEGIVISRDGGVELAIADKPLVGFVELNLKLTDLGHLDLLADYLQICATTSTATATATTFSSMSNRIPDVAADIKRIYGL